MPPIEAVYFWKIPDFLHLQQLILFGYFKALIYCMIGGIGSKVSYSFANTGPAGRFPHYTIFI